MGVLVPTPGLIMSRRLQIQKGLDDDTYGMAREGI